MALPYRNGYIPFDFTQNLVKQIKLSLTLGHLVAFSIPVFDSWYNSDDTIKTGRILMPLPGESAIKDDNGNDAGHAMAIVGYQDSTVAGGGYFIVRNSWGAQQWAPKNIYAAGYGIIPYAYVENYRWEASAL